MFFISKVKIKCPYCRSNATLRPSGYVYGDADDRPGFLYVCNRYPKCDSYVAAHRRTKAPMGMLADGDLRNKRIQAHHAFDWLWKSGLMTKWQAYKWMQGKLGLSEQQAHIAMFDYYLCDRLIAMCDEAKQNRMRRQRKGA